MTHMVPAFTSWAIAGLASLLALAQTATSFASDPPVVCQSCDAWNALREPFRVFGNTYFVGRAGLSAVLIVSDDGLVLLDGGLPQSAASIDASIRALGFRTTDVRLIGTSHTHFDHVGGVAALQRASGAMVAASPLGARALERGRPLPEDPQAVPGVGFPVVTPVRLIGDGETLRVGAVAVTARFTPGHTPGGTTWTWRSCEGGRCLNMVYADSLTPVSSDGFQFTRQAGLVEAFRRSIATIASLPCDVLITVHPEFTGIDRKLAARASGAVEDPFVDPMACRAYAADAARALDRRIAAER